MPLGFARKNNVIVAGNFLRVIYPNTNLDYSAKSSAIGQIWDLRGNIFDPIAVVFKAMYCLQYVNNKTIRLSSVGSRQEFDNIGVHKNSYAPFQENVKLI